MYLSSRYGSGESIVPRKGSGAIAVGIITYRSAGDIFVLGCRNTAQVGQFQSLRLTIVALERNFLIRAIFGNCGIGIGQGGGRRIAIGII